jgi:hypothetical protein
LKKINRWAVWGSVALLALIVFLLAYEPSHAESRHGRVVDADGKPIAGAYVQIHVSWRALGMEKIGFRSFVRTDAAGEFAVTSGWKEGAGDDAPSPFGYSVDLEACHPDFIPTAFSGQEFKDAGGVLVRKEAVRQNKDEIVLTLGKRPDAAAPYRWRGLLTWDPEIEKGCRLETAY